jgi:hypothetical protein
MLSSRPHSTREPRRAAPPCEFLPLGARAVCQAGQHGKAGRQRCLRSWCVTELSPNVNEKCLAKNDVGVTVTKSAARALLGTSAHSSHRASRKKDLRLGFAQPRGTRGNVLCHSGSRRKNPPSATHTRRVRRRNQICFGARFLLELCLMGRGMGSKACCASGRDDV